jgi:phage-related protein
MPWDLQEVDSAVTDFLVEIGPAAEARVVRDLRRMATEGHLFRGHTEPLGDGLYELRVAHNKMAYRLLFGYHDELPVFVLCFCKKKQKTPKDQLKLAKLRLSRVKKEEVAYVSIAIH